MEGAGSYRHSVAKCVSIVSTSTKEVQAAVRIGSVGTMFGPVLVNGVTNRIVKAWFAIGEDIGIRHAGLFEPRFEPKP